MSVQDLSRQNRPARQLLGKGSCPPVGQGLLGGTSVAEELLWGAGDRRGGWDCCGASPGVWFLEQGKP